MALATKVVGQSSAQAMKPQAPDLVNTAMLVRGRVYCYKNRFFDLGKVEVVSDDLADALDTLYDETQDNDGERFEKPFFDIKRNVPRPVSPESTRAKRFVRRLPVRPLR